MLTLAKNGHPLDAVNDQPVTQIRLQKGSLNMARREHEEPAQNADWESI